MKQEIATESQISFSKEDLLYFGIKLINYIRKNGIIDTMDVSVIENHVRYYAINRISDVFSHKLEVLIPSIHSNDLETIYNSLAVCLGLKRIIGSNDYVDEEGNQYYQTRLGFARKYKI